MSEAQGEFPKICDLCGKKIGTRLDLDWHGLGNCAPICARCAGSGIEPQSKDGERERKLVEALRSLRNECSGAVGIALPELHVALGNTNVACLKRRIEEADAALALFDQPVAPKEIK